MASFLPLPPQHLRNANGAWCSLAPRLSLLLALVLVFLPTEAYSACPAEKLYSLNRVKEKGVNIAFDRGTAEQGVSIELPISVAQGGIEIDLSDNVIQHTARIPVRKRFWGFRAKVKNLSSANLDISYTVSNGSKLYAATDPTSYISVSIATRNIDVLAKKYMTHFDAYIDLIVDYSAARVAGNYTGSVTVTVNCKE